MLKMQFGCTRRVHEVSKTQTDRLNPRRMAKAAALKPFLSEIALPQKRRKRAKELGWRSDPKPGAVCNCLRKVLGVVRQQPVGLAGHRREEDRYVCGVP